MPFKFMAYVFLLGIVLLSGCNANPSTSQDPSTAPFENISVAEFKEKMDHPNVVLLDVRTPAEIDAGTIGDPLKINVMEADFAEKIKNLDPNQTYLVFCKAGGRSSRACDIMSDQGFKNLYNLSGGYTAWQSQN